MKKRIFNVALLLFVIVAFLFSLSELAKDSPALIIRNLQEKDLENKILVMRLKLLGIIPIGTARIEDLGIEQYDHRKVYHLKASAEVMPYISRFFNARAEADSYVDIKNLSSLKFVQRVETPGDYDYNREIIYDQKRKIMKIGDVEREILKDTRDPISAIFYIRNQDFKVGKEIETYINTNQKNYLLTANILTYKEIKLNETKIGIWLVKAEVRRHDKSPRHKTSIKIWFLDNKTKTPLLIRVMASGGLITARLINVK